MDRHLRPHGRSHMSFPMIQTALSVANGANGTIISMVQPLGVQDLGGGRGRPRFGEGSEVGEGRVQGFGELQGLNCDG